MKKKEKKFISNLTKVLRKSKTKDPSKYWFLLKEPKKNECIEVSLEDFETFFKNLNHKNPDLEKKHDENFGAENVEENADIFEILNSSISDEEIATAVKSLKNKKACGVDNILNEEIKSTFSIFKKIYKKTI